MIKILNVYTQELDDPEKAVREILEPLDIKNSLLKNSVALLFCHVKFIETGVAEAVYKSLPFDVVGCTSLYFGLPTIVGTPAAAGSASDYADVSAIDGGDILTVTILTSDDIGFTVGVSVPLNEKNVEECVYEVYQRTAFSPGEKPAEPPALVFAFPPTITMLSGDVTTAALYRACGGIPVFGSLALDINTHIEHPKTIFKAAGQASGESGAFDDRMALLLFRGPVKPRFFHSSFPEKSILPWDAVITEAAGNRIISINNSPALSFIRNLGFFTNDIQDRFLVYPLVVEYPNNETNVVVLQDISPEGHLMCSMNVQAGGILNMGAITADSVLESAKVIAQGLKNDGSGTGFIMFSCFLRNVVLGGSSQAEFELVRRELGGHSGSWLFLNSGGELCPVYTEKGELVNRFHQFALIACQF
jgi:hypothetical protein